MVYVNQQPLTPTVLREAESSETRCGALPALTFLCPQRLLPGKAGLQKNRRVTQTCGSVALKPKPVRRSSQVQIQIQHRFPEALRKLQ
ncbi:Transportin-2 [Manis pentadactyla]|nr:Transportin-2 [Manis pentadactyla]